MSVMCRGSVLSVRVRQLAPGQSTVEVLSAEPTSF